MRPNLTFSGFGHNHEVYTCLDWTPDAPELQSIFVQAWRLVCQVYGAWGHSSEARTMLHKTERISDWLLSAPASPAGIRLLHTLDAPLIEQCRHALAGHTIRAVTILSPFLDNAAAALAEVYHCFRPDELRLVLQDRETVGNVEALEAVQQSGISLCVHRFAGDGRYQHAKVYLFQTDSESFLLTGSANCTRAAWLADSASGNLEMMLLRRADSREHFAPLLEGRIEPQAITSWAEIDVRRLPPTEPERAPSPVRLLDVTLAGGLLTVDLEVSLPLLHLDGLQLRLATSPPHFLPLGLPRETRTQLRVALPEDLQRLLRQPVPASVWGTTADGTAIDLHSNELWTTNVDLLRYEVSRYVTGDPRAGAYLADMDLGSEEEWRDLYDSLVRLVELDVAGLKRRGGTYTASPPERRAARPDDEKGAEIEVRLIQRIDEDDQEAEVSAALFRESPLHAWLEYVRSRLPGAESLAPAEDEPADEPAPSPTGEPRPRRRMTPPERIGRRFVNLVQKYRQSLDNPEYMRAVSLFHILAYYAVFQRITWLLLQHRVIDNEAFVRLATDINEGFFGPADGQPPAASPLRVRHVQRIWLENWRQAEVHAHALVVMVVTEELSREQPDQALRDRVLAQNLRVLAAVVSVTGVPLAEQDMHQVGQVAQAYDRDGAALERKVSAQMRQRLSRLDETLDGWIQKIPVAIGEAQEPRHRDLLYRAMQDYARARCDILGLLRMEKAQEALCSDMIFWMNCASNADAVQEWSQRLLDLLERQGRVHEAALATFRQGKALYDEKKYKEAVPQLRQALQLAEHVGDKKLARHCRARLDAAEMLLR